LCFLPFYHAWLDSLFVRIKKIDSIKGIWYQVKIQKKQVKKSLKSIIKQDLKDFLLLYHIRFFIFLKACYMLRISFILWAGLTLKYYDSCGLPHENAPRLEASLGKSKRPLVESIKLRPASGVASTSHGVYCDLMYTVFRGCYCI
jgi:hypothetical protein